MNTSTRSLLAAFLGLVLAASACGLPAPGMPTVVVPVTESSATPEPPSATETTSAPEPTHPPEATATPSAPVTLPEPQDYQWVSVLSGVQSPIGIANAGDGSGRLFIIEQGGIIRFSENGQLSDQPFLNIKDRVGANGSERGLLGLAFHPKYKENGYFYVNYTGKDGNSVVSRFTASGNEADPTSEKKLLGVPQPFPNHNGGSVAFGPDGYLYLGFGDGGSGGDPLGNGQALTTFLGKILRIDVDSGDPYSVPIDNPFMTGNVAHEVWAYGLRNPWRFSFDTVTGDMYIADVGQNQWEEVDFLRAGLPGGVNFGWNAMEGSHPYAGSNSDTFLGPIAEYSHSEGGCSITGGYVYRGAALPEWQGVYLYGDYCSGKIWGLHQDVAGWQTSEMFQTGANISSFGVDENGEIYFSDYGGEIFRLEKK